MDKNLVWLTVCLPVIHILWKWAMHWLISYMFLSMGKRNLFINLQLNILWSLCLSFIFFFLDVFECLMTFWIDRWRSPVTTEEKEKKCGFRFYKNLYGEEHYIKKITPKVCLLQNKPFFTTLNKFSRPQKTSLHLYCTGSFLCFLLFFNTG